VRVKVRVRADPAMAADHDVRADDGAGADRVPAPTTAWAPM
jgi:hypothetical protein